MLDSDEAPRRTPATALPGLIVRLTEQCVDFVEQRLKLAEEEVRAELARLASLAVRMGLALAVGFVGFELVTLGVAIALARRTGHPAAVFLGLGALYLIASATFAAWVLRRAARVPPLRRTATELEEDREWLKGA